MGDSRQYFLSTAEDGCGVLQGVCESSGEIMKKVGQKVMECGFSKVREARKVAM